MTTIDVQRAEATESARCIEAQVLAFASDPLLRWMLPDPGRFLTFFPRVLAHYGGRAFEHGTAYRTTDYSGSALWLPPGIGPDEEALGAVMEEAVDPERLGEVFDVLEAVGAANPEKLHWFLPAIGVDPRRQGAGVGSALLHRSLEACDARHEIAYLEASNPRNVPLYQRFGFEVASEIRLGSAPLVVPMRRPAR